MSAKRPSAPWRMVSTAGAVWPGPQGRPAGPARGLPEAPPAGRHLSFPFLNRHPTARVDGPHAYIPAVHLGVYGMRVRSHRASARQAHGLAVAAHAPHGSGPRGPARVGPGLRPPRGGGPPARPGPRLRAPAAPDAGRGRGPVPARVSAGLVPGPAPSAPRLRLGLGPAAAPAGTGSTPGPATGGPADQVVLLSPQDADWGFASPSQPRTPGTEINPVLPEPHGLLTAPVASETTGASVGGQGNRGPAGCRSFSPVRRQGHASAAHRIG